jgi:DNA-nicking Smr family endonuclease
MAKKSDISDEERDLFRDAMQGVKKISPPKKASPPPIAKSLKKKDKPKENDEFALSDYETDLSLSTQDLVEFNRGGLQHKVLRKLRSGQYNVQAILDLHGMTVVEARTTLEEFLQHCREKGISHTLIIHGKGRASGKPILKNKLNIWLKQVPFVLAFCSAKHPDGSSGAMYVLLQKK